MNHTARTFRTLLADGNSNIPTRVEVLRAGTWPAENNKGEALSITLDDLHEFVSNFKAGYARSGGSNGVGLPIDFSHEYTKKAAGWITNLDVVEDSLIATVEWSSAGEAALKGKEYKCFSPMFTPSCLGLWEDPEDHNITANNVLEGGALTNIPFFKDLTPIMASRSTNNGEEKNVIYIKADERKRMPTLEEVLAKDASTLSEDDKKVLTDNESTLTDEQKTQYGFEVAETPEAKAEREAAEQKAADEKAAAEAATKVAEPVAASAVKGTEGHVVMAATEVKAMNDKINSLQVTAEKFERGETLNIVTKHLERGAIKADQVDSWVDALMASKGEARTAQEKLLTNLPDNSVLASEIGKDQDSSIITATAEVRKRANELIKAAKEDNQTLDIGAAYTRVFAADKTLEEQFNAEQKGVN